MLLLINKSVVPTASAAAVCLLGKSDAGWPELCCKPSASTFYSVFRPVFGQQWDGSGHKAACWTSTAVQQ